LVTIALVVCALVSATATVTERLHLEIGVVLTVLLTLLAVLSPVLQSWLKQAQSLIQEQDQGEEQRVKALADRARSDVLEQVDRSWVRPELEGSLYLHARIQLHVVDRQEVVDNPLREFQRRPEEVGHLVPTGKPIGDVYRELGKQLLILGEPGAGKTTLLMELAQHLLNEAQQSPTQSMPIVFHLSTWVVEHPALTIWLVDELYKRYGVPRRLGRMWVETDQVIPLLDGLDEVPSEQRDSCVAAINAFHDDHGVQPLVVSSRLAEYKDVQNKLRLRGAIEIEPLSRAEVSRYLRQAGRHLSGVRTALRHDKLLEAMLTTPLLLSIAAATYQNKLPYSPRTSGTLEERRRYLLTEFIDAMLSRPLPSTTPYSRAQTVTWLAWLARTMRDHGEGVFYIDWIQPSWLPTPAQRRLVTVGVAITAGATAALLIGLVAWWAFGDFFSQPLSLVVELVFALPAGLIVGWVAYEPTIEPSQELRWSAAALRRKFLRWMVRGGLAVGLPLGLMGGLFFGLVVSTALGLRGALLVGLLTGLVFAVPAGLILGLLTGLASGLEHSGYVTRPAPGRAIQTSKRNALLSGFMYCVVFAAAFALVVWLASGLVAGPVSGKNFMPTDLTVTQTLGPIRFKVVVGLLVGLSLGLPAAVLMGSVIGLQRGGGAYLRHWVTRWLLIANGVVPHSYVTFLEYARRLILLRRRGGGYEFVHRLLLEQFTLPEVSVRLTQPSQTRSTALAATPRDDVEDGL
jgi:DNA polymerase III delta prime subunit